MPPQTSTRTSQGVQNDHAPPPGRRRSPVVPSTPARMSLFFPAATPVRGGAQAFKVPTGDGRDEWRPRGGIQDSPLDGGFLRGGMAETGDRFIPDRSSAMEPFFQLLPSRPPSAASARTAGRTRSPRRKRPPPPANEEDARFDQVLRGELCPSPRKRRRASSFSSPSFPSTFSSRDALARPTPVLAFSTPSRPQHSTTQEQVREDFSDGPLRIRSQEILQQRRHESRYIPSVPFAVLDAPNLVDNYYTQALSWSPTNKLLAVALGSRVYTSNRFSSPPGVSLVCDMSFLGRDSVTSVRWLNDRRLAVATKLGYTKVIHNIDEKQNFSCLLGHDGRIGTLDWSSSSGILTSGGHDKVIQHYDLRLPNPVVRRISLGAGEICRVKWSENGQLAVGTNEGRVYIFDGTNEKPLFSLSPSPGKTPAVGALAWSPHTSGLLCTGNGTTGNMIHFWDTKTKAMKEEVDTGSQVCDIVWSRTSDELVSAHGFGTKPPYNCLNVWKHGTRGRPTERMATLKGHTYRALHLALSPDSVVSASGDETLRFWSVFPPSKEPKASLRRSLLDPTAFTR